MEHQIQIISIEGNIGSGKSTLLTNLKKYFNNNEQIIFLDEPVNDWNKIKDETGTTILEKFYADQKRYSFSFQIMAYISRLNILKNAVNKIKKEYNNLKCEYERNRIINFDQQSKPFELPKYVIITERSLFTDRMVFAQMLYDSGNLEHINYMIYLNWFNAFIEDYPIHKIIYIKTDPNICHVRINTRHRAGEEHIPIEYLKTCAKYHDNMLDKKSPNCVCKDQLILKGDTDIYKDVNVVDAWLELIEIFIYN